MKILKFLFMAVFLLFPLGELARIQLQNNIAISINDILIGSLFSIWIIVFLKKRDIKKIWDSNIGGSIILFILLGLISLLVNFFWLTSIQFYVSFLYLLRWIVYASLFFITKNFDIKFKNKIQKLMIVSGLVIVLTGFVQYFFYPNLRNLYYLGWDEHLYRMFSSFLDPNFAAVFFSLFIFLTLGILFNSKKRNDTLLYLLILISGFISLLLTYSRGGYMMFAIGTISILFLFNKKKYIVLLVFAIIIGILFIPKNSQGEGVKLLRTASIVSRSESAQKALTIFTKNPVFGVGFDTYRYAQEKYYSPVPSKYSNHSAAGTDNSFLFVLATTGIIGFLAYLHLWFQILKSNCLEKKFMNKVFIASSIALFVGSLFINALFYPFIMEWIWILLGLSISIENI